MCRALLVAQGRHPTWRTYSARRVAPGRLLVDQAKKSHLGLYTVLSELSANTKLAWRAVHGRGPAIAVAKSLFNHQSPPSRLLGDHGCDADLPILKGEEAPALGLLEDARQAHRAGNPLE